MARAARRSLTPSANYADPLAAGIGGFTNSLNQALIRSSNQEQQRRLAQGKQKSALEMAMERFYNQKLLAEDPNKVAPAINPKTVRAKENEKKSKNALSPQEAQFMKDMATNKKILQAETDKFDPMKNPMIIKQFPETRNMDPVSRNQFALKMFSDPSYPDEGVKNAYNFVFQKDENGMSNAAKARQLEQRTASQVLPNATPEPTPDIAGSPNAGQ